jgi:hypothetical protein
MAESFDVKSVAINIGAATGAGPFPALYIPADGGAVTIINAKIGGNAAGTSITGQVITLGNVATGGTPAVSGTVGAFAGTIVYAAGVVHNATISTAAVSPGTTGIWLGFSQASGTAPAATILNLSYVQGK